MPLTKRKSQMFLHANSDELACEGPAAPPLQLPDSSPPTPRPSNSPKSTPARSPAVGKTPASPSPAAPKTPTDGADEAAQASSLRARILAYGEELDKALSSNADGDEAEAAEADANVKYSKLKLQLSEIQRAQATHKRVTKGKGDRKGAQAMSDEQEKVLDAQGELLKEKIKTVESDYTFRKTDAGTYCLFCARATALTSVGLAEKLYREERTKLDAAQLSARLSGTTLDSPFPSLALPSTPTSNGLAPSAEINSSTSSTPAANGSTSSSPPSPGRSTADTSANDDEEGDFFGNMLDEMPTEETTEQGTTIPVRNLSLPKHFSGKTPKVSLEETVRKLDKGASVSFSVISRSRAVRAAVKVRWSENTTGKTVTHRMDDIACWDEKQAYNYIATLALFDIATSPQGSGLAVNKALPTVFRDLWDELVAQRQTEDEEDYRRRLKVYRAIAEPRCQEPPSRVSSVQPHHHSRC